MLRVQGAQPSAAALAQTTTDAGRLLVGAAIEAPCVPTDYSQIAAHMIHVGEAAPFKGRYRDALRSAFVRRGVLSLQASANLTPHPRRCVGPP